MMGFPDWLSGHVFRFVHGNHLVYNTCWEDPRLDRIALNLGSQDTVLVITSAGCNALDYVLAGAGKVIAVDMNPRQNALLELKLAGIRNLEYPQFFSMFGQGRLHGVREVYIRQLRASLSPWARAYWDKCIEFFEPQNLRPFYFRGTCGTLALGINWYINCVVRIREWLDALLAVRTVEEQKSIYEAHVHDRFWSPPVKFLVKRDAFLSLAGVPRAQRKQVESQYRGGIAQFVIDCVEAVFARLPLADNYFWRVYLTGQYTPSCCPEYLKPANFELLKEGLATRIQVHTGTVHEFLKTNNTAISRFVLLDHMDWLSGELFPLLEQEWQWIVRRATPGARILWRSGGLRTDFVDRARVEVRGCIRPVGEMLRYNRQLADTIHQECRVHTYGSFHIADLAA